MDLKKKIDALAFILGMKKNKYKQAYGTLFFLGEDGDVYACALGQGLLETVIDEDELRAACKPEPLQTRYSINSDGQLVGIKGRTSPRISDKAMSYLETLPTEFKNDVVRANDNNHEPVPNIAAKFRNLLGV